MFRIIDGVVGSRLEKSGVYSTSKRGALRDLNYILNKHTDYVDAGILKGWIGNAERNSLLHGKSLKLVGYSYQPAMGASGGKDLEVMGRMYLMMEVDNEIYGFILNYQTRTYNDYSWEDTLHFTLVGTFNTESEFRFYTQPTLDREFVGNGNETEALLDSVQVLGLYKHFPTFR